MHIVAWWLFFVSNQIFFNTKVCYSYFLFFVSTIDGMVVKNTC